MLRSFQKDTSSTLHSRCPFRALQLFPLLQPTNARNCPLIRNVSFKYIKLFPVSDLYWSTTREYINCCCIKQFCFKQQQLMFIICCNCFYIKINCFRCFCYCYCIKRHYFIQFFSIKRLHQIMYINFCCRNQNCLIQQQTFFL